MAEYATSFDSAGAYSFDAESIKDLWEQVKRYVGDEAQISVNLEGDQRIKLKDVAELVDDAFIRRNFIEELSISGAVYGVKPHKAISVTLRRTSFLDTVSVSLSGDREECTARRVEIENILAARQLWYWFAFARTKWRYFFAGSATVAIAIGIAILIFRLFNIPDTLWTFLGIYFGSYVGVSIVSAMIGRLMFPKLVFEIGKSTKLGERAKLWRNVMGVVIGLGLIVGVVAGLIVEKMK